MNTMKTDVMKLLCSSRIWAAFVFGSLLMLRPLFEVWKVGAQHLYSPMELLSLPLATSDFTPFAAVFCAIPYATSFCDDYKSGYLKFILVRVGSDKYSAAKVLTVALSGALVMTAIFGIVMICCAFTSGAPETRETIEFMSNTIWSREGWLLPTSIPTYLGRTLLAFLFGAVWALVALGVSIAIPNRHVTLIMPFVLYQALWILMMNTHLNPLFMLRADDSRIPSFPFVVLYQLVWLMSLGSFCFFGLRRRCLGA